MESMLGFMKISFFGVVIMKIFQVAAEPIINVAFASTNLSDIEIASKSQHRDSYAYVFDNDIFMNLGRIAGGTLFILLNYLISPLGALKYVFIILGISQLVSAILIKRLNNVPVTNPKVDNYEESSGGRVPEPSDEAAYIG